MHDRDSLLLQWARRISGDANLQLTLISGDASFRRYSRGGGLVWVDANPKTEKNHEFVRNAAALNAKLAKLAAENADVYSGVARLVRQSVAAAEAEPAHPFVVAGRRAASRRVSLSCGFDC